MKLDDLEKIKSAYKAFSRGGDFLQRVFREGKRILSGEDCMYLFNTYAIPPREIILMAISHHFHIEHEEFAKLLGEQREISKNMRQCEKG